MSTILLFGDVTPAGEPRSALAHYGAEAYDNYMLAPYMRELLKVRHDQIYICWSPAFAHLYAAAVAFGAVQFEEVGSTLFSTIDKMSKLDDMHQVKPNLSYIGIEISRLLIETAEALHPMAEVRHLTRWQDIPTSRHRIVSRSYQSTSYAFRTTSELFDWVTRSTYGIHGIRWSLSGADEVMTIAGNRHTLFDPDRFSSLALASGLTTRVIKSDIQRHSETRFSLSWVETQRMNGKESAAFDTALAQIGESRTAEVCRLSLADLIERTDASESNAWAFYSGRAPFDFRHPKLEMALPQE